MSVKIKLSKQDRKKINRLKIKINKSIPKELDIESRINRIDERIKNKMEKKQIIEKERIDRIKEKKINNYKILDNAKIMFKKEYKKLENKSILKIITCRKCKEDFIYPFEVNNKTYCNDCCILINNKEKYYIKCNECGSYYLNYSYSYYYNHINTNRHILSLKYKNSHIKLSDLQLVGKKLKIKNYRKISKGELLKEINYYDKNPLIVSLNKYTVVQLKEIAKVNNIEKYYTLKKEDLISKLKIIPNLILNINTTTKNINKEYKFKELYEIAKNNKLTQYSTLSKSDLFDKLKKLNLI